MSDLRRSLSLSLMLAATLSVVFIAGFAVGTVATRSSANADLQSADSNVKDFLTAYHLVTQRSYFRPFDRRHLVYAAIDGMLAATGDPHTLFLSPSENVAADQQLNGSRFSGIGAIVVPDRKSLEIVAPLPKTPAAQAGLQAGDIVIRINGSPVSGMTGDNAIARIHGPAGTSVRLTLVRSHQRPFTVTVRRARIPPVTAYGRLLDHHLGYIQIMSFGDTTNSEVSGALSYVLAHDARGVILDLRGNPGGYVDAAQQVVSHFLSRGVVAYEKGPDKQVHALPVIRTGKVATVPLAVLVDAGTASAAEITAGALRDNHRAILIGTRTYGKGSMQSVYALADGSSIRITDRLWLTPAKKSIQTVGIRPDLYVDPSVAGSRAPESDVQLLAAERYLTRHTSS